MIKKLISVLLVFALLVAGFSISAFAASTVISVDAPQTLPKKGETFTVTVSISGNPGFSAVQYTLGFDQSKVDCSNVNLGTVLKGTLSATNPDAKDGAIVAAATTSTLTGDGQLATYTFTALKDLDSLSFEISDLVIADSSGTDLSVTVNGASLVTEPDQKTDDGNKTDSGEKTDSGSNTDTDKTDTDKTDENKTDENKQDGTNTETTLTTSFTDTKGHWAESYIAKAVKYGLFKGNDDGSFGPNNKITRAQFVTVLYRNAGSPEVSGTTPFTDIQNQIPEFKKAITWAYVNKYVSGKSATQFDPSGSITRQEAMKILFAYSGAKTGGEAMFTSIYDGGFTDSKQIATWAKPAVYWAYYNELISGAGNNRIAPTETATRAQLAKILVNYIDKFEQ